MPVAKGPPTVEIAPDEETLRLAFEVVVTNVTAPLLPVVFS